MKYGKGVKLYLLGYAVQTCSMQLFAFPGVIMAIAPIESTTS